MRRRCCMKCRVGFVSNSSSSSFLIVGITRSDIIKQIAEKMGKYDPVTKEYRVECSCGYETGEHFNFYGSYEPEFIGVDVSEKIKKIPFEDLKKEFQETIKKNYGIEIHPCYIDLHFGEVGE